MSDLDHETELVRLTRYFDGELAKDEEHAVLDHLHGCAICSRELDDMLAIQAMAATPRAAPHHVAAPPLPRPRRRWVLPAAAAFALAAAALIVLVMRRDPAPRAQPLALAASRGIEVRFTAAPFAAHRPYTVMRGAASNEQIDLGALSDLERRHEAGALVAALASSGDLVRAEAVAAREPSIAVADRAALALLARQPERALELLDGELVDPAARWNRALALRDLGLVASAQAQLAAIAQLGEPGWADEARVAASALAAQRDVTARFGELRTRGLAWIAGTGPAITVDDVAAFPAFSRIYFLDALRVAADRDAVLALAPLADALDRGTRTTHARAALDRVAGAKFGVRAKFRETYRSLVAGTFDYATTVQMLDELDAAGRDVDDIFIGALVWTGQTGARLPALQARIAKQPDPWFELVVAHEQIVAARADKLKALDLAQAAHDSCKPAWAYRCAQIALDLAEISADVGRVDDAVASARQARDLYRAAGAPALEDRTLGYLAELERHRGRRALARALFREAELRAPAGDCRPATYARVGLAKLSLVEDRVDDARALLASIDSCAQPPDEIALTIAVDIARRSASAPDRELAARWLAAARDAGTPRLAALAEVGAARLAIAADPAADAALKAVVARAETDDTAALALRAWATDALLAAAGERGDWAAAAEAARLEIRAPSSDACTVAASIDQDRQTVAVRGADGTWRGIARRAPIAQLDPSAFIPVALADTLRGCSRVEVLARPPLHGKPTLLPGALPWVFVGGPPRAAPAHPPRTVIVTDVEPADARLQVPRLATSTAFPAGAVVVRGEAATPTRVLAELATATYVEINAHGTVDLDTRDASFLALSAEPSGRSTLTAADVRGARLGGAVVVLAACRTAELAPYLHRRWSLPDAFLAGGARSVIATDVDVPDRDAPAVFAELRERIGRGEPIAAAVAALRAKAPASWAAHLVVFE